MASLVVGGSLMLAGSSNWNITSSYTGCRRGVTINSLRPLAVVSSNLSSSCRLNGRRFEEPNSFGSRGFGSGIVKFELPAGIVPSDSGRRLSVVTKAGKGDSVNAPERILAALGYILPLFDGIQYGRFFFMQFPAAEGLLRPLFPLLSAYKGFPYSNFIAFFSLYLLVVRNSSFSRYVRFNAMQAVVLDVLLILPTLVERTFGPRGGVGLQLLIIFYNTVFLFLVSCFLFGVFSCLLGKTPRLPIVADAADAQVEGSESRRSVTPYFLSMGILRRSSKIPTFKVKLK